MRRLLASLRWDIVRQIRYQLYTVSVLVVAVWGIALSLLPDKAWARPGLIVPALVAYNLLVTAFYFMTAQVLMEKSEGVLSALAATPLRAGEYLLSKALSLSLLALGESLVIALILFGAPRRWGLLLGATLLLGVVYTLLGFIAIAKYDSINEFLMPSVLIVVVLTLPLLPHFGLTGRLLFYLHPIEPGLVLLRGAYAPLSVWELAYGVLALAAWVALSYRWARRRFEAFVTRAAGN